jgi:uncharacterized protein YodC (DUF2158 family)
MAFKAGELVKLKSGSPLMTVSHIGHAGGKEAVWCVWFEKNEQRSAAFPPETLEAAKKPEPTRLRRSY